MNWFDPRENNIFDDRAKYDSYRSDVWWSCGLGIAFGLLLYVIYTNLIYDLTICCKG